MDQFGVYHVYKDVTVVSKKVIHCSVEFILTKLDCKYEIQPFERRWNWPCWAAYQCHTHQAMVATSDRE